MTSGGVAAVTTTPERKGRKTPRKQQQPPQHETDHDDALLSQSIASKASSCLVSPQVTLTCYIPTRCVGAVIGRRGSTILQMQKQAQQAPFTTGGPVRVSILGHEDNNKGSSSAASTEGEGNNAASGTAGAAGTPPSTLSGGGSSSPSVPYTYSPLDYSSPHWTPVVIRGDCNAALAAAFQLQRIVVDEAKSNEEFDIDDVVLDLPLSSQRHAALVGKRGVILAATSADTGVRIMVPRKDLRHDVVQLEGELQKVRICLERILTLACDFNAGNKKNNNKERAKDDNNDTTAGATNETEASPQQKGPHGPLVSEQMTVSNLPPQTKLRQIGRKTFTTIKRKKSDDEWILTIMGSSRECVQSSMDLITKFNNDQAETSSPRHNPRRNRKPPGRNRKVGGRGGGGGGSGGGGAPPNSNSANNGGTTAAPVEPASTSS